MHCQQNIKVYQIFRLCTALLSGVADWVSIKVENLIMNQTTAQQCDYYSNDSKGM